MKYRLKSVRTKKATKKLPAPLLPAIGKTHEERINIDALFEVGELPMPPKAPKKKPKIFKKYFSAAYKKTRALVLSVIRKIREHRKNAKIKPQRIFFYLGVLCSVFSVAALSVAVVLVGLFGSFLMPYATVTYPHLIGADLGEAEHSLDENFEIITKYRSSDNVPEGTIMAQSPAGGITRKIYNGKGKPSLTLTVSSGRSFYTLEALSGLMLRDARLLLKNASVGINAVGEYSDSLPRGTIISTHPKQGSKIYSGEVVTLKYSLGKRIQATKIPDLYGLSEAQALSLLDSRKLELENISYVTSDTAAGKVISQAPAAFEVVPEGTKVKLTVSLGLLHQKSVPDLYGLDISGAKKKLAEVGLVLGGIFAAQSAAAQGSVVTQVPPAGTTITSSITAVDIYISS